jgi:hypothetical protein
MSRITHNPDAEAVLYVRVPGAFKNELARAAEAAGLSINAWCANQLRLALRESRGLPAPPPAAAPLPTPAESLFAWLHDEPLITPCGKQGTCPGLSEEPEVLAGVRWCASCGIRLG